mmetsp:Transcript_15436/g.17775  ORF Transcript_15436/g.17775 Transcript_15436/m.17775 type:complete len:335 (+) Transcript_15436:2172-3176(+)
MITLFQILVTNDWNQIAKVYLKVSGRWEVYIFFISANLLGVSLILNVFISFFVGSFVANNRQEKNKNQERTTQESEALLTTMSIGRMVSSSNGKGFFRPNASIKSKSYQSLLSLKEEDSSSSRSSDDSDGEGGALAFAIGAGRIPPPSLAEGAKSEEIQCLDVHERQGFDMIFNTVAGVADNSDDEAVRMFDVLELFQSLMVCDSSGWSDRKKSLSNFADDVTTGNGQGKRNRDKFAWMICCQSGSRFRNKMFQKLTEKFIDREEILILISKMQSELVSKSQRGDPRKAVRSFASPVKAGNRVDGFNKVRGVLHIRASLVKNNSSIVLFVADVK